MKSSLPAPFPVVGVEDDSNPAIRLFGKRFINEQGALELLAEFLAVAYYEKRIGNGASIPGSLPSLSALSGWSPNQHLQYRPPIKLNLKLFALLGASRLDSRHETHLKQHARLMERLKTIIDTGGADTQAAPDLIEELLRGFQGAGLNRTWCAQTFFPISPKLLTRETIWNISKVKGKSLADWSQVTGDIDTYFSTTRRNFLARGGELLYLQICNALASNREGIESFLRGPLEPASIAPDEADPEKLHGALDRGLGLLASQVPASFDRLIDTIEGLDPETTNAANPQDNDDGWLECEWCPQESWQEGYLFAIELSRLLGAALDPIQRLELMTTGCALQVLRSLCAQSARYAGTTIEEGDPPLGYTWLLVPPDGATRQLRLGSQRNLQTVQGLIQRALRTDELRQNAEGRRITVDKLYREADTKYGHRLLLSLGKKLGIVVPQKGPGAHFVMTDNALRYLVLALLRPGERCTYEDFLERLYLHYSIAIEGEQLDKAAAWSGLPPNHSIQPEERGVLAGTLRAGGFLFELSDACSIVRNTYQPLEPDARDVE